MKKLLISAGALAALAFTTPALAANTATANATVNIVSPLSLTKDADLNFGTIVGPFAGEVVHVDTAGARTCGGLTCSGTFGAAAFTVTGTPDQDVVLTIPNSVTLNGSVSGTLDVDLSTDKPADPTLELAVIHADEREAPAGREPIRWRLLTDRPVDDLASAIEKLDWYSNRWKIETYHKVLKSGCQAERSQLRTAERLTNLLAVLCIVAWRVFWLTMTSRARPEAPAGVALTEAEIAILDQMAGAASPSAKPTVSHYLVTIAKLGGYLARSKDPPPGNLVVWRGLTRLMDIHLGFELSRRVVGN